LSINSNMFTFSNQLQKLLESRTNDLSEPVDLYLEIADEFEHTGKEELKARATFIREQCQEKSGKLIFDKYREIWGIPNFKEDILTVEDFKRGFLWTFRDHTTSWSDNQDAKAWFLTSEEARFIRHYEFWSWDNEVDECLEKRDGDYKTILDDLLKDGDYEVLQSPVYTNEELFGFIKSYSQKEDDFAIEEIIEDYISNNPNFVPEVKTKVIPKIKPSVTILSKLKQWLGI